MKIPLGLIITAHDEDWQIVTALPGPILFAPWQYVLVGLVGELDLQVAPPSSPRRREEQDAVRLDAPFVRQGGPGLPAGSKGAALLAGLSEDLVHDVFVLVEPVVLDHVLAELRPDAGQVGRAQGGRLGWTGSMDEGNEV